MLRRFLYGVLVAALLAVPLPSASAFAPDDWRVFIQCDLSHSASVDPIVSPGVPSAHLHDFFGNVRTSKKANYRRMTRDNPESTCDTSFDTAAYWAPAIRNIATGEVVNATSINVYLQNKAKVAGMVAFPRKFKYVTTNWEPHVNGFRFKFEESCWSGVIPPSNRYDGAGVLATPRGGVCPDGFPIQLPHLSFNTKYPVDPADMGDYEVVSLPMVGPHADFWNTWNQAALNAIVAACLNPTGVEEGCARLTDANITQVLAERGVTFP